MEKMGNPFTEDSTDLLVLDSGDIADPEVIESIRKVEKLGQEQFNNFVETRLEKKTSLFSPVTKNKLQLFSNQKKRTAPKEKLQIESLKKMCTLFAQLYVSCLVRGGNMDEFFRHENQPHPPSLSQFGELRQGTKSDLVHCLEKNLPLTTSDNTPNVTAVLLDGAVIVNMLKPGAAKTFHDYGQIFIRYITCQLQHATRLDIVWDLYLPDSLKATAGTKRGKGLRRRVDPSNCLPGNWGAFLRNDHNKEELFRYLAQLSVTVNCEDKEVSSTMDSQVLCSIPRNLDGLSPCTHEEADTRLLLHAADCAQHGYKKIMLRTVDTDVVVLSTAIFKDLAIDEMWISFGMGKSWRYIPIQELVTILGPDRAKGLPVFHALTGCDQTSSFAGRGKVTAWDTWERYPDVTTAFKELSMTPTAETVERCQPLIERFVIQMYDSSSKFTDINDARKKLFTKRGGAMDAIPPTKAALCEHIKRVAYQAGHCWGQTLRSEPSLPSPDEWGWQKSDTQTWQPLWTKLPEASKAIQELIKCKCMKGCKTNCKCKKANLRCTGLCGCVGTCN